MSLLTRFRLPLAAVLLAACGGAPAAAKPNTSQAPARFTDANVAALLSTGNAADIAYGRLALARSARAEVRAFAQTTVNDHTSLGRVAGDLLSRLALVPEDNEASLDFRDDAQEKQDVLRGLEGAAFDSAYVANEVAYHTKMLAALDATLIPSARNGDLKRLLQDVRPVVVAHLGHAEHLQKALAR